MKSGFTKVFGCGQLSLFRYSDFTIIYMSVVYFYFWWCTYL